MDQTGAPEFAVFRGPFAERIFGALFFLVFFTNQFHGSHENKIK
jgi:hypothetical protein